MVPEVKCCFGESVRPRLLEGARGRVIARGEFDSCPATYQPAAPLFCRSCRHTLTPGQGSQAQGSGPPSPPPQPPTMCSVALPRLWPSLRGGSWAAGPSPGGPRSVALQESGALAGVPGWPPLSSLSPHLGKAFPPAGPAGQVSTQMESPTQGPPKERSPWKPHRAPARHRASGHWLAFRGRPAVLPTRRGRAREGLGTGRGPTHTRSSGASVLGCFRHGCVSRKIPNEKPHPEPSPPSRASVSWTLPSWRLDCTQRK